jgi:hypothetical protein
MILSGTEARPLMRIRRILTTCAAAAAAAGLLLPVQAAHATSAGKPTATASAPSQAGQIFWERENQLIKTAAALTKLGQGAYAGTYSNVAIDPNTETVTLYAVNPGSAREMISAAEKTRVTAGQKINIVRARYTQQQITSAVNAIAKNPAVYTVGGAPDGSGIQVTTAASEMAQVHAQTASVMAHGGLPAIPVTVTAGVRPRPATSWRWDEAEPFTGGAMLLGNSVKSGGYVDFCTSGIMAENSSTYEDYVITAAHCYNPGTTVYGNGAAYGDLSAPCCTYGNRVGIVTGQNATYDFETIDTGNELGYGAKSAEADQPEGVTALVPENDFSVSDGESVCQDGAMSYFTGHGVPCGIKIVNTNVVVNVTWDNGVVHSEDETEATASSYAVRQGDSGGLVFTICGSNCRSATGLVSAEGGSTDPSKILYFTDAWKILQSTGLSLAPTS